MAKQTYYAAQDLKIQSKSFAQGDVLGTGDVASGDFTPSGAAKDVVALGHVEARLQTGKIVTEKPDVVAEPKSGKKSDKKSDENGG